MNIFVKKENVKKDLEKISGFVITDEFDVKHVLKVMRKKVGDILNIIYDNKIYESEIIKFSKNDFEVKVLNVFENEYENNLKIDIIQAIPKSDRIEYFLEKATELGVNKVILTTFENSVVKAEKLSTSKIERFNKIILAAAKQSKRFDLPKLEIAKALNEIDYLKYDEILLAYEKETVQFAEVFNKNKNTKKHICIIIGPEGGISKKDFEFFKTLNATSILLGNRILRSETAGIAIISVLQYLYGDF